MELLHELFATVFIAILFSFLVAKLVSFGGGAASSSDSGSNNLESQNLDQEENATTSREIDQITRKKEELTFGGSKFEIEPLKSQRRVKFPQNDRIEKVESMSDEVIETESTEFVPELKKEEEKLVDENLVEEEKRVIEKEECSAKNDVVLDKVEKEVALDKADDGEDKDKDEMGINESDDDWEGIERSELEKVFAKAAKFVEGGNLKDDEMELYGLNKVATEGPCHEQPPMALNFAARAKWNAWQRLGSMNPEVAMEQYVALVSHKVPGWMEEEKSTVNIDPGSCEAENPSALASDSCSLSHHHPNITEERIAEVAPGIDENDLISGPNLESRAKE